MAIMGPILDTVDVSRDIEGESCDELGWHLNSCFLQHFTVPITAHPYCESMSSLMISHHLLASFPTAEKKER
jgi:hypothetical protein